MSGTKINELNFFYVHDHIMFWYTVIVQMIFRSDDTSVPWSFEVHWRFYRFVGFYLH